MTSIITWNVNGVRAASKKGLRDWIDAVKPDVLCLQETKALPEQVPEEIREIPGYTAHWISAEKKGYSGVGLLARDTLGIRDVFKLGDERFDCEGRVMRVDMEKLTLLNCYFPNSQEGGMRLPYKLAFCDSLFDTCQSLRAEGRNVLVCGDFNIAHKPIDLANPKNNEKNPGYLPEERDWMERFVNAGYVDTFRMFTQDPGHYTWWSYRFNSRANNVGWRIDYHVVDDAMSKNVKSVEILGTVMGSDHCPVRIELEIPS